MRLMRLTYGRSGSMLRKVVVAAPPAEMDRKLPWSVYLLAAIWIAIPVAASLVVAPKANQRMTLVDTSRLTVPPPAVPVPQPKPEAPVPRRIEKTPPPVPAPPVKEPQPVIVRRAPAVQEEPVPRIQRTAPIRSRAEATDTAARAYIPRQRAVTEAPTAGATITRSRSMAANETPVAATPSVRRRTLQAIPEETAAPQLRATRPKAQTEAEQPATKIAPPRRRTAVDTEGTASRAVGVERGISLETLEVCASPLQEERKVKDVLRVVGSRPDCRSGKGRFVFKGTQRVSSFNLIIYPAGGRRPSNKCEELENAYTCLTEN